MPNILWKIIFDQVFESKNVIPFVLISSMSGKSEI